MSRKKFGPEVFEYWDQISNAAYMIEDMARAISMIAENLPEKDVFQKLAGIIEKQSTEINDGLASLLPIHRQIARIG